MGQEEMGISRAITEGSVSLIAQVFTDQIFRLSFRETFEATTKTESLTVLTKVDFQLKSQTTLWTLSSKTKTPILT